jgi:hypothetical protein
VFTSFAVETDKRLTTKGSITNPLHKLCPTHLLPWTSFLDEQGTVFGKLYSALPTQTEAFESREFLRGLGERISLRRIANEKNLEYFQHIGVEDP